MDDQTLATNVRKAVDALSDAIRAAEEVGLSVSFNIIDVTEVGDSFRRERLAVNVTRPL